MDESIADTVSRLRRQGTDDATCEVKASGQALSKGVWESVSAFANTRGGRIILGLEESGGFTPVSDFRLDKVRDQFVAGIGDGGSDPAVLPAPTYELRREEVDGAPVLCIDIVENSLRNKPCHVRSAGVQRGSYKRVDDKDIRLSTTEIHEMQTATEPADSDRSPVVAASIDDLDTGLLQALLTHHAGSRALRGAQTLPDQLKRLNVVDKAGEVTLAGLLTLGVYPQQFFPRLLIDVTVHPGREKAPADTRVRFVHRELCDGPMPEAIRHAIAATRQHLQRYSTVEGGERVDHVEIPEEVLREAISNAVVHREYHPMFLGESVNVDVYPDRVEVGSPGGLWGGKTADNLDDGRSTCRNQILMQLLQHIPQGEAAGFTVEGQGGGVPMMIHQMQARALDRPGFDISPDRVKVVLRRHGAEIPALREWLRGLSTEALTDREESALLLARREGSVTVRSLRAHLGMDSDDVRAALDRLVAAGLLRPEGEEAFVLWSDGPGPSATEREVLGHLSLTREVAIHDIAAATGRAVTSLRPILRGLVDRGLVVPTAPPQSRNRKYLLAE